MSETKYWEMTDDQREALPPDLVGETEEFVMVKINQGRQLLRAAEAQTWEELVVTAEPEPAHAEDCNYYDLIASLLFAAKQQGFDPEELCRAANEQVEECLSEAAMEARGRRDTREDAQRRHATISVLVDLEGVQVPFQIDLTEGEAWKTALESRLISWTKQQVSSLSFDHLVPSHDVTVVERDGRLYIA